MIQSVRDGNVHCDVGVLVRVNGTKMSQGPPHSFLIKNANVTLMKSAFSLRFIAQPTLGDLALTLPTYIRLSHVQ